MFLRCHVPVQDHAFRRGSHIRVTIAVLEAFPGIPRVQEKGWLALSEYLSRDERSYHDNVPAAQRIEVATSAGCLELLAASLARHRQRPELVRHLCTALASLIDGDPLTQQRARDANVVPALLAARHVLVLLEMGIDKREQIASRAIDATLQLLDAKGEHATQADDPLQLVALVRARAEFSADQQFVALLDRAWARHESYFLHHQNGTEMKNVLAAMRTLPDVLDMQHRASKLLMSLVQYRSYRPGDSPPLRDDLAANGAIEATIHILTAFPSPDDLLTAALGIFQAAVKDSIVHQQRALDNGARDVLTALVRACSPSAAATLRRPALDALNLLPILPAQALARVQFACVCFFSWRLVFRTDGWGLVLLVVCGSVLHWLLVARWHGRVTVPGRSCLSVGHACAVLVCAAQQTNAKEPIPTILATMKAYTDDEAVQACCTRALMNKFTAGDDDDAMRQAALEGGVVEVFVAELRRGPEEDILKVLTNLAQHALFHASLGAQQIVTVIVGHLVEKHQRIDKAGPLCVLLQLLLRDNVGNQQQAVSTGGLEIMATLMVAGKVQHTMYQGYNRPAKYFQSMVLPVVSLLAQKRDCSQRLVTLGALEALTVTMLVHRTEASVLQPACECLAAFLTAQPVHQERALAAGVREALQAAADLEDPAVRRHAQAVLALLQ